MELFKYIGKRINKAGHYKKWGEFLCSFCLTIVERRLENGIRQKSCGCQHYSANRNKLISEAKKGIKLTEEHKQKIRDKSFDRKHTEETKEKMRKIRVLQKPPTLGLKFTQEQKNKQSKAKMGENNPNWNGGSSFEEYPQEFYYIRNKILKRDNYICQDPNCEHKTSKLHVHHIDYDKKNNNPENLITLCRNCHNKTSNNSNRDYCVGYYKKIMENNL